MAYVRVWLFEPIPAAREAFEAAYGPDGEWARLFHRAAGFLGTELLKAEGPSSRYLTLDRWISRDAWEAFLRDHRAEYAALDRRCESLTAMEQEIGSYEEAASAGS
ncbi:MAG TPA: antibiotic biosynthesis monooxygenase [Gemmatimonadales bacterium]